MKTIKTFAIWTLGSQIIQCAWLYVWIQSSSGFIYGTNDDAIIASIASGELIGKPDPHWIFIEPLISAPLTWIQSVFTEINIYSNFLLLISALSSSVVLGILLTRASRKFKILIVGFWFLNSLTFLSWFAMAPTYTSTSLFCVSAALVSLIYLLQTEDKIQYRLYFSILILFITLSFLIRFESILIFVIFSLPIILISIHKFNNFKHLKVLVLPFLIIALVFLINSLIEKITYPGEQWADYVNTNSLRHQIQLREPERILESNYSEFGWNQSVFKQFKNFQLADPTIMNDKVLNNILSENSNLNYSKIIKGISFSHFAETIKQSFLNYTWILILIVIQILIFSAIYLKQKFTISFLIFNCLLGFTLLSLVYILFNLYHFPERIVLGVCSITFLSLLSFFSVNSMSFGTINRTVLISIYTAFIIFSLFYLIRFNTELDARQKLYSDRNNISESQTISLAGLDPQAIVISGASSLRFDWINPYEKFRSIDPRNKTLILGWHNLSPVWSKKAASLGLNPKDIYENLLEIDTFWASQTENDLDIKDFLEFKFNSNIQTRKVTDLGSSDYGLYKITKVN